MSSEVKEKRTRRKWVGKGLVVGELQRGGHEFGFGPSRVNGIRRGRERDIGAG